MPFLDRAVVAGIAAAGMLFALIGAVFLPQVLYLADWTPTAQLGTGFTAFHLTHQRSYYSAGTLPAIVDSGPASPYASDSELRSLFNVLAYVLCFVAVLALAQFVLALVLWIRRHDLLPVTWAQRSLTSVGAASVLMLTFYLVALRVRFWPAVRGDHPQLWFGGGHGGGALWGHTVRNVTSIDGVNTTADAYWVPAGWLCALVAWVAAVVGVWAGWGTRPLTYRELGREVIERFIR